MDKKIAVILPVHSEDKLDLLKKSVESILGQTYQAFDLIIALDGPVPIEIEEYINNIKLENVIILEYKPNEGLPATLNKVIEYCKNNKYSFIARMDADDISHTKRLEKQIAYLENNKDIDAIGTEAYIINSNNDIVGEKKVAEYLSYKVLRKVSDIIHPSVMFKSSFFEKVGLYDKNLLQSQDYDLWFRAVKKNIQIVNIKENLYYLRYDNNLVNRRKRAQRYVIKIKKRYLKTHEYFYLLPHLLIILLPKFFVGFILHKKITTHKKKR